MSTVVHSQGQALQFIRVMVGMNYTEWLKILQIISSIFFQTYCDVLTLRWDPTGKFSTHSMYTFLNNRGVLGSQPLLWWSLHVPHKIRIFMRLAMHRKILTKDILATKSWTGVRTCHFCTDNETKDHLFLTCILAQQVWF